MRIERFLFRWLVFSMPSKTHGLFFFFLMKQEEIGVLIVEMLRNNPC